MYQKSFKGSAKEINNTLKEMDIRGEWVVIINSVISQTGEAITLKDINDLDLPPKQKAKLIAKLTGQKVKDIYNTLTV